MKTMLIRNIFCLNDWDFRSLFILILSVYFAYCGSIMLNLMGFPCFFIQHVTGFILMSFIPGVLILRVLKLHNLGTIETIVYTTGLSLTVLLTTGYFINFVYPLLGIFKPLSFFPIVATISCVIIFLGILSYLYDRDYIVVCNSNPRQLISPIFILTCTIPCISIIGSFVTRYYGNNIISVLCFIVIAFLTLWFANQRVSNSSVYSVFILATSVALLFGDLFISDYPRRLNVDGEFFFLNQVIQNQYWDPTQYASANTVLSIVILGPVFSSVMGVNIYSILKIVYPLIFSMIPLVLYCVFKKEFSARLSFFATLFFMFNFYFFTEALLLRRQQVALLFFALILLILVEKNVSKWVRALFFSFFAFSLIVSHYAVSVNVILIFLLAYLLFKIHKQYVVGSTLKIDSNNTSSLKKCRVSGFRLSTAYVLLLIALFMTWYMYMGFSVFANIVESGNQIVDYLALFSDPSAKSSSISSALGGGFFESPLYGQIYRILQYTAQALILISVVNSFRSINSWKGGVFFRIAALLFLVVAILLPFFTLHQNVGRLYFFTLFILAPCCVDGASLLCYGVSRRINWIIHITRKKLPEKRWVGRKTGKLLNCNNALYLIFAIIFLVPFFIYNTGMIFDTGQIYEKNNSSGWIPRSGSLSYGYIDTEYHNPAEIMLASKVPQYLPEGSKIYGDVWTGHDLVSSWFSNTLLIPNNLQISGDSYVFLRSWNIGNTICTPSGRIYEYKQTSDLPLTKKNLIYNNAYASLYA